MFPWSAVFSTEPKIPGQRSPEELVTNTLMLELAALLKRTDRIRQERALELRRRSSTVNYSWLAEPAPKLPYELTPGEVLELQDLCAKIPPSQCGPIILRFRKLVTEFEPEVHEVARIFRSVLHDCLDEEEDREVGDVEMREQASRWNKQRSKSLSFVTFRTKFRINPFRGGGMGGSRNNLPEESSWVEEEEEAAAAAAAEGATGRVRGGRRARSRSMPEISPMEERAHS